MFKIIIQASLMMTIIFSQSVRADDPMPAVASMNCTPTETAIFFGSRFHIKCDSPMQVGLYRDVSIYYFSISTDDRDDLNNALEIATRAIAEGKRLRLWVKTSYNGNPSGCQSRDCRRLTGIALLN